MVDKLKNHLNDYFWEILFQKQSQRPRISLVTSHLNESALNPIGELFLLELLHSRYLGWMILSECHESPAHSRQFIHGYEESTPHDKHIPLVNSTHYKVLPNVSTYIIMYEDRAHFMSLVGPSHRIVQKNNTQCMEHIQKL